MTYDQLLTLEHIISTGSFKAASKAMFKSQPSLTVAIKNLEIELGFEIFDRSGYRPVLTENGKHFYKKARRTLEEFQNLQTFAQEITSGFEQEINICVDQNFPIEQIATPLKGFFEPHINTSLNLSIDILEGIYKRLEEDSIDFAIGVSIPSKIDFDSILLTNIKMIPLISPDFKGRVNPDNLKCLPQIVAQSSKKEAKDVVHGVFSDTLWYTTDSFMKEQLIASGLGWGRLPAHQVVSKLASGELLEVKDIPEVQRVDVPMHLMKLRKKKLGPNATKIWDYLRNHSSY